MAGAEVVVLYGSQLGTGADLAKQICAEACNKGYRATVYAMNEFDPENLPQTPLVIFVTSSTGDGDPPDNSVKMYSYIKKKAHPKDLLRNVKYTLLGLGDSSFNTFMNVPRVYKARLTELGATCFHPPAEADDCKGIDKVVDPWLAKLWPSLQNAAASLPSLVAGGSTTGASPASPSASPSAAAAASASAAAGAAAGKDKYRHLVVLYGSQTGNAAEIAKKISADAAARGFDSRVYAMNEFGTDKLPSTPLLVIVTSSTGDGDPPDNSAKMFAYIKKKTHAPDMLRGIKYTVLGLGDSNYTTFMGVPRTYKKRLSELGASCFYPCGEADEVSGLEEAVDPWVDGLFKALDKLRQSGTGNGVVGGAAPGSPMLASPSTSSLQMKELVGVPSVISCRISLEWAKGGSVVHAGSSSAANRLQAMAISSTSQAAPGSYSVSNPFLCTVSACQYLTQHANTDKDRRVMHLEFDVTGSGLNYRPGDAIGVLPENDPAVVQQLIERLGLDGDAMFSVVGRGGGHDAGAQLLSHIPPSCSVHDALLRFVDVTSLPRKSLLRMLADYCPSEREAWHLKHLASRGGKDDYKAEVTEGQPTLMDLLEQHPSCAPPFDHLLDLLPPLLPRLYSITSCQPVHGDSIHVAFTVVDFVTATGIRRKGVATTWLERTVGPRVDADQRARARVPVFLKQSTDFRPPASLTSPLIMIGPGTGVCPFRGFLHDRRTRLAAGQDGANDPGTCWLFFGNRRPSEDFLFKDELEGFTRDSTRTLSELFLAWSREGPEKVYVQDLITQRRGEVYTLLREKQACIYVCGDGAKMAKDVQICLENVLKLEGGMSDQEAMNFLNKAMKDKRYVRDIWS